VTRVTAHVQTQPFSDLKVAGKYAQRTQLKEQLSAAECIAAGLLQVHTREYQYVHFLAHTASGTAGVVPLLYLVATFCHDTVYHALIVSCISGDAAAGTTSSGSCHPAGLQE
jgi:hypothetical protein